MSIALSFVSDDVAAIASDSQFTGWDEETGEITETAMGPKVVIQNGGWVSTTSGGEGRKVRVDLQQQPAGDLSVVKGAVQAVSPTRELLSVVQVFGGDGEVGTLYYDSDGVEHRLARFGASFLAAPPVEDETDHYEEMQREVMESAAQAASVEELVRIMGQGVHYFSKVSRWIGGPAQVGTVTRSGEPGYWEILREGQEHIRDPAYGKEVSR